MKMLYRTVKNVIQGQAASDGAGVKLTRTLGQRSTVRCDPFLMLDEIRSDNPDDYIAGFPAHPHRGFETVTYMLKGKMRHEDHLGNRGVIDEGGVQWMTAGRGIVHSEIPEQRAGMLHGFQLWINLPAVEKMKPADYRDARANEIPEHTTANGCRLRHIAGHCEIQPDGIISTGLFNGIDGKPLTTNPLFIDIVMPAGTTLDLAYSSAMQSFCYVYQGDIAIGDARITAKQAAVLGDGELLSLFSDTPAHLLLLAGNALNEPIAQYGPFVMNTPEQIEQTLRDYRDGALTAP